MNINMVHQKMIELLNTLFSDVQGLFLDKTLKSSKVSYEFHRLQLLEGLAQILFVFVGMIIIRRAK